MELRRIGREQLARYDSVTLIDSSVVDAHRSADGFSVTTDDGQTYSARKLLLAAGVVDDVPRIEGFRELYGLGVFHCPYCDGWEVRDQPLAVYGRGDHKGGGLALELTAWSANVVLCTDGPSELSDAFALRLARYGIVVRDERIVRLTLQSGSTDALAFEIVFENGTTLQRSALFFNTGRRQSTDLAERLGCEMFEEGGLGWIIVSRRATCPDCTLPAMHRAMFCRPSLRRPKAHRQRSPSIPH
jgi:thioredoxin reductase